MLVLALPVRVALYQPLAAVLVLGCLAAVLAWCDSGSLRTLALAGALAGLAFATKQNVGVFAAAALLAAVLLGGGRLRALAVAAGSYAGAVALTLIPVAATGGLTGLWDYGSTKRDEFIDLAAVSYRRGFDLQWQAISEPDGGLTGTATSAVRAYELLAFVLVPVVLVALALAWRRTHGGERKRVVIVLAFTLAAVASIYPRADISHVSFVVPTVVVGGLYAARMLVSEAHLRVAAVVLLVLFEPGRARPGRRPGRAARPGDDRALVAPAHAGRRRRPRGRGRAGPHRGRAGRRARPRVPRHLRGRDPLSGLRRRERDAVRLSLRDDVGRDGEEQLADEIEQGRFAAVCVNFASETDMVPRRLVEAIEGSLVSRGRPGLVPDLPAALS